MKEAHESLPILAIVIGVSSYFQKDIVTLPAAQVDAVNFARAIRNWGIPENNIYLFLNEDAEKRVIDELFEVLAEKKEDYKLIFYFCGHGYRDSGHIPKSYLLFHDSYIKYNKPSNSISLDLIIKRICKLNARESYVIIDACYLRINTIRNPKLEEELQGQKISRKSLFCLLSSGIEESFESEKGQYGYFTEALLKSLCKIRQSDCSPSELLNNIRLELEAEELPVPEPYNIGNQKISFICHSDLPSMQKGFLYRHKVIAQIQDVLIQNRQQMVCLIGDSGIGKSVICHQVASDSLKTLYLSIPFHPDETFDAVEFLAHAIQKKIKLASPSSAEEIIHQFDVQFPYYVIILDQLERLNPKKLNAIFEIISKMKARFVLTSCQSLQDLIDEKFSPLLIDLEVPPFSEEEGEKLIRMTNPDCSEMECKIAFLVSHGNPLKMRMISFHLPAAVGSADVEQEIKTAIAAVYSCGCYINEHLFAKVFNLQERTLKLLEEIGLILRTEKGFIPHEFLNEIAESEELIIQQQDTLNYWYEQIDDLPDQLQAAQYLILAVKCFGYEEKAERYLKTAFQTLQLKGKEHLSYLIDGADIFLTLPYLTETSLLLAEILIEWEQFELAGKLLDIPSDNEDLMHCAKLCKAQKLWRTGHFTSSIALCTQLLAVLKNRAHLMKCYFFRGISCFLNGNWNQAFADFTFIHKNAEQKHYVGRAQCMLGSILGVRGIDLQKGKEYLETGTRLLVKLKDLSGAWMGWNNLGEMFWKCGEYRSSAFYLAKALEVASSLDNEGVKLETFRNLLQLHLRMSGLFSKQATDLIAAIEKLNWSRCEYYERAQILNTLATAYLFRRDVPQATSLLEMVIPLTAESDEYHIYTSSNLALLYKLLGNDEKSAEFFNKALFLAEKGENRLAILQIKNDFNICFKENFNDSFSSSAK
jgi:tetratricopeptide (TPR) repeat protein